MPGIPKEQLAKLSALRDPKAAAEHTLERCDVWLVEAGITAWVVEAKDRPHLVVGLQGPVDAPTRVLLIEGTKQPQSESAELT